MSEDKSKQVVEVEGSTIVPLTLEDFDFDLANARALGMLALRAGGELTVPPPSEALGYSISYQSDGSVHINAVMYDE